MVDTKSHPIYKPTITLNDMLCNMKIGFPVTINL